MPNAVSRNNTSSTVSIESSRPPRINEVSSLKGLWSFFCVSKLCTNSRICCFDSIGPPLTYEKEMTQETQVFDQRESMIGHSENAQQAIEKTNRNGGTQRSAKESR